MSGHAIAHHCPPLPSEPARSGGLQGAEMLQEVAAVSPHEYERQQKDDLASSGGVRNVAKFVESLADRWAGAPLKPPEKLATHVAPPQLCVSTPSHRACPWW